MIQENLLGLYSAEWQQTMAYKFASMRILSSPAPMTAPMKRMLIQQLWIENLEKIERVIQIFIYTRARFTKTTGKLEKEHWMKNFISPKTPTVCIAYWKLH